MEIILAEVIGFCFGVRRAIELAEASLRDGRRVNTLGPLVHNPQEIVRLDAAGIHAVERVEDVHGDTVVIRAHGTRPEVFAELRRRHLTVVDATCPFVTKSQRLAREFTRDGLTLVIVGHPDHPEVQGIRGYASHPSYVISLPEDVATLPAEIKPGVLAQTTVNEQLFLDVVTALRARFPEATVRNTVCSATRERQDAVRQLAARVDAVLVIGGRHSSNTNRLTEVCQHVCPKTFLIETADEIDPRDLLGCTRVGITAGASTPAWLIEQVVRRLQAIDAQNGGATPVQEEAPSHG